MPRKTLGLAWPLTMDQTKGNWRLWCLWAVLGEAGGSGTGGSPSGGRACSSRAVHLEHLPARSPPDGVSQRPSPIQVMQAEHRHCAAGWW